MTTQADFKPIYQVIKDDILNAIRHGDLKPHDPLESRHALIKRYGCSWATVHRAVSELILEGVLYAQQGRGTFVAPQSLANIHVLSLHPISSWHHSLVEMMEGMREETYESSITLTMTNLPHHVPAGYDLDWHIILTPALDQYPTLQQALDQGARFMVLGSDYPENPDLPCINADTRAGTKLAVQHLIDAGHRAIGLVGVMEAFPNYQREIEGYQSALEEADIPVRPQWILSRSDAETGFAQRIVDWLEAHPEITAIFAADYATSLTIFQIAREKALDIPKDLSLVCMDELPTAELLSVPPVRLVQPFRDMGRLAVSRLVAAMKGGQRPTGTVLLPCTLLSGQSVQTL